MAKSGIIGMYGICRDILRVLHFCVDTQISDVKKVNHWANLTVASVRH